MKIDDYISTPKKSGYRAVHVMAVFHGHVVEIQLRTEGQHAWATVVESAEMSGAKALREGEGPPQVLDLLRDWAEGIAYVELGQPVPDDLMRRLKAGLRAIRSTE